MLTRWWLPCPAIPSCRFAQSQRLLTVPRLLFSTGTAVLVPLAVLGLHQATIVWMTVLLVTVASAYYGNAIIGGIVGDYLGGTIQVLPAARVLVCVQELLDTMTIEPDQLATVRCLQAPLPTGKRQQFTVCNSCFVTVQDSAQGTLYTLHCGQPNVKAVVRFKRHGLLQHMCVLTCLPLSLCCSWTHCRSVSS